MPTSARQNAPFFMKILGKFAAAQRADVGIGPYIEMRRCIRLRRSFSKKAAFCWADRVVRPYRNGIIQCPCRAMRGRGLFLRYGVTGYVTPHTVMDASSSRSISWENSQVFFTSLLSQLPA